MYEMTNDYYHQRPFVAVFGVGIVMFIIGFVLIYYLSYIISQTNVAITDCNSFLGLLTRALSSSADMKCNQAQFIGSFATLYLPVARTILSIGMGIMIISFVVWLTYVVLKYIKYRKQ